MHHVAARAPLGTSDHWELWPGSVYPYLQVWDDIDPRTVQWRRNADGNVEVFV